MSKEMLRVSAIVLALCLAFGESALAQSDPYADAVDVAATSINHASCGGICGGIPANALGAPDDVWVALGDNGWITLDFTDNTCLVDEFTNDVTVYEFSTGVAEPFKAQVGQSGVGLASNVFSGTGNVWNLNVASTGLAAFNRIRITDGGGLIQTGFGSAGYDLDAVTCLNSLAFGTAHITKTNTGDDTIEVGIDTLQGPYSFEIVISNPDGADLTDVILKDNVPAEFDITDATLVTSNSLDCPVSLLGEVTKGKGNGNQKLAPDFIQIGPLDSLGEGESCTITVGGILTDFDHPGQGRNPAATPTSCPDGTITLNDGVSVYLDADLDGVPDSDELLFVDDDSLELDCVLD
ncbi:MAG: hypothetical protein HY651_07400 [Acidobacteria bacterium]|nr:hypothetical protein [Acidobacteriota bacterium]